MIGIFPNLSNTDYHSDKNSISRSAIMDYRESAYRYWSRNLNPERVARSQTPAMKFGEAFHTYVLEPERFKRDFAVEPEKVLLKDVGDALYKIYKNDCAKLANSCMTILSDSDYQLIIKMADALKRHDKASDLLRGGDVEKSFFWRDEASGLIAKARPDILHTNMIIDLKTIADASFKAYQRDMLARGYYIQGAMIRDAVQQLEGRDISNVVNVCIEKVYPYSIAIYIIDGVALDAGKTRYQRALCEMAECRKTESWRDYEIQTVGLPMWENGE